MPNLFLLGGTFQVPSYTGPSAKQPYLILALGRSMDYPFPQHMLFSHVPLCPVGQAGREEAQRAGLSIQAAGCVWAEPGQGPVGPRTGPAGSCLLLPSPPWFSAEPPPSPRPNNEKGKTLNECAVK